MPAATEKRPAVAAETAVTDGTPSGDAAPWPALDGELLSSDARESRLASVPSFPLALLPQPWGDWASGAAQLAGAPVDYVVQALLASVSGMSGRRTVVVPTRGWQEPLRLWLAAVGAPSTGKLPALISVRRLLAGLEAALQSDGETPARRIVLREGRFERLVVTLNRDPRGRVLWRDESAACLAPPAGARSLRQLEGYALSIVGSLEPEGAERSVRQAADAAARFLYAWPQPLGFRPIAGRNVAPSAALRGPLSRVVLAFDALETLHGLYFEEPARLAFDAFALRLHDEIRQAEGLEAAWLGKGSGAVACLAGTLAVMAWAASTEAKVPGHVGREPVERAVSLWWDYYRPHARALFRRAGPTDADSQARRVVRWLQGDGRTTVSREDVRRIALGQTVNAGETDRVMARLVDAAVLRPLPRVSGERGGRPALRWTVNPSLEARRPGGAIFPDEDRSRTAGCANSANSANRETPRETGIAGSP